MFSAQKSCGSRKGAFARALQKEWRQYRYVYLMAIPMIVYYILFCYMPMYGASIAFKDFVPKLKIAGSPWVRFKHFRSFFQSVYFTRLLTNTLALSLGNLVFGFPAPIILAILLNEVRQNWFKRTVQTISYLPHFISVMVICGMIVDFTASGGVINDLLSLFGFKRQTMLLNPSLFRPIYIISEIWQSVGWGSIVYLAALTAVDPALYEAARIDGAGKFRQILHVTLPGIAPTIVVMLILKMGSMMSVGSEKVLLLYNSNTYSTADVISTYVYRKGLLENNFSFSTAVGLFNSVINFTLVVLANQISRKVNDTSLW
ncbi:MAG: ABC transporter permease subunit [Clostridiales bacterium]|nr:ABC transporter permease subunit [Clostridiales bacterium]MDY2835824.1 ABC transporter permease subunit [Candidatus Aphodomonas sp.]